MHTSARAGAQPGNVQDAQTADLDLAQGVDQSTSGEKDRGIDSSMIACFTACFTGLLDYGVSFMSAYFRDWSHGVLLPTWSAACL